MHINLTQPRPGDERPFPVAEHDGAHDGDEIDDLVAVGVVGGVGRQTSTLSSGVYTYYGR